MPNPTEEARIRKILEDWAGAVHRKDAAAVVQHYARDLVSFDLAPPLATTGVDRTRFEDWFATWDGPIDYEIASLEIHAGESLAFAHSLNRIGGTKTDGEKVDVWVRATVCLCKEGDVWKVVHEHSSVPFYMDGSDRAAIDLTP